jgi:hypothetical protein
MYSHSERSVAESKNLVEITLKVAGRDPSIRAGLAFSLGMTNCGDEVDIYGTES